MNSLEDFVSEKGKIDYVINQIKSLRYTFGLLIDLNLKLEACEHKMSGLARGGESVPDKLNRKRERLPMPKYHGGNRSILGLMEEEEDLIREISSYSGRINELRFLDLLSSEDISIIFDLWYFNKPQKLVAKSHGFSSREGMIKHIRKSISEII